MTLNIAAKKLSPEDIIPIRDLVDEYAGLYFEEKKFYFLEKRLLKRIQATDSQSAFEYYRFLKLEKNSNEMKELVNLLTTNETYFYRNQPQLASFVEEALPMVLEEKKQKNDSTLRIWSAASSTGEEPYTIAILLREHLPDFKSWNIEISASDIDNIVLEKAKTGIYDKRSVKDVPENVLRKYFVLLENGKYQLIDEIRQSITFEQINLMDRIKMRTKQNQDFVFCRNVLIYFSVESRKQVVNSIFDSLNKGGFIFLGHAESVGKISAVFQLVKFKKSLSYRK